MDYFNNKGIAILCGAVVALAVAIGVPATIQAENNQREQTKRVEICLASEASITDCAVLIGEKK